MTREPRERKNHGLYREWLLVIVGSLMGAILFVLPWFPNELTIPSTYHEVANFFARLDSSIWVHLLQHGSETPAEFYDGNILLPLTNSLASNDPRLFEGLLAIPIFRLFPPITAWGVLLLMGLFLTAVTSYWSGKYISGSAWGGAAVAVLFGFGMFRANHVCHIEGIFQPLLPLVPAAIVWAGKRTSWRRIVALSVLLALAGAEYSYTGVLLALIVPPAICYMAWRQRSAKIILSLAGAGIVGAVILLPVASIYWEFHQSTMFDRSIIEVDRFSADLVAWLSGPRGVLLQPFGGSGGANPDARLFPGFVLLALGILGIRSLWRRFPVIPLMGFFALVLSFGTFRLLAWRSGWELPVGWSPYELIYEWFLPLKAIRAPARFGVFVHLVLALGAGLAVVRIAGKGRAGKAVVVLLLFVGFFEARAGMNEVRIRPDRADDPAYRWIAVQTGEFGVVEVPMGRTTTRAGDLVEAEALFGASIHQKRTPNGTIATFMPWNESLAIHLARPRQNETLPILQAYGIRYVLAREPEIATALAGVGLTQVDFDKSRFAVLKVPNPSSVPQSPAELQERLLSFPHSRVRSETEVPLPKFDPRDGYLVYAGQPYSIELQVKNDGVDTWCGHGEIFGMGVRGSVIVTAREWEKTDKSELGDLGAAPVYTKDLRGKPLRGFGYLPFDVAPGESAIVQVRGFAPPDPGSYRVEWTVYVPGFGETPGKVSTKSVVTVKPSTARPLNDAGL